MYRASDRTKRTGLQVAMARHADAALAALTPEQQAIARRIFVRLVHFGEGRTDTRRQQPVTELRSGSDEPLFEETLSHLAAKRLLTLSGAETGPSRKVDIAHEALISGWSTLQQWLKEGHEAEQTRRRLEARADEWVRLGRRTGGLLDDIELREASRGLENLQTTYSEYSADVKTLVEASRAAIDSALRLRHRVRAVLLCLFVAAIGFAAVAWNQQHKAVAAKKQAEDSERNAQMLSTSMALDRGLALCEQGDVSHGMLWLARSLEIARPDAADLQRCIRTNLASWGTRLSPLRGSLQHQSGVVVVAFSPDGKTVLTGAGDLETGKIQTQLWDAASAQPLGSPFWRDGVVLAVLFSRDGKALLIEGHGKTARLLDATTGQPLSKSLEHQGQVTAAALSPDGKTVLTASDKTAQLWDAANGTPVGPPLRHKSAVTVVAFSPDGHTTLTGSQGDWASEVQLREILTGKPRGKPLRMEGDVFAVVVSRDGKRVLAGSGRANSRVDEVVRGEAYLWDGQTGELIGKPLPHRRWVTAVAISPDGTTLLTGSGVDYKNTAFRSAGSFYDHYRRGEARLWNAATGQALGPSLPHEDSVRAVAFSPDGRTILTGSQDMTARLWDAATGMPFVTPLRHQDDVRAIAFSGDGRIILMSHERSTETLPETARLWDGTTGEPVSPPFPHQDTVWAMALSPDGKKVLTGSGDVIRRGEARVWDITTGRLAVPALPHPGTVSAVAFGPDGRTALTGCYDGNARLWDVVTGQLIGQPLSHGSNVRAVAFSALDKTLPNGNSALFLTGGDDNTARLWDARTGKGLSKSFKHQSSVTSVAFSPDGKTVLTGSYDGAVRHWEVATGGPVGQPLHHPDPVRAVAFSPDGKLAITGSGNRERDRGQVRLWDVMTGRSLGPPSPLNVRSR